MKKIDFDDYACDYNSILTQQLHFFDGDNDYFAEYKVKWAQALFQKHPKTILDFGCGIGRSIPFFQKYFSESIIQGCDASKRSLAEAQKQFPSITFHHLDDLYHSDQQFDLIFISCVFHHIPPNERESVMELIKSHLAPNGKLVIFEHNPYNPVARYLVNTCPFDQDAILLKPKELKNLFAHAGIKEIQCHYTLFFPQFLKWLRPLEKYLCHIPLGGQYVIFGTPK